MAPKRKAAEAAEAVETAEMAKKYKSAIDDVATEYLCPITAELPLDPVTAEDGRIYERQAIEQHFATRAEHGDAIRSPMTNEPMGQRLFPATQVKNSIEKLVRSGAIGGDKAERWLERLKDEEEVEKKRKKAEGGNAVAMYNLGNWYYHGKHGLQRNKATAFGWYTKGADVDDASCTAMLGLMTAYGEGTAQNTAHGLSLTTQAAMMGSKVAAYFLGGWYREGEHGLPVDNKRALRWYRKVATGAVGDLKGETIDKAAAFVRELDV